MIKNKGHATIANMHLLEEVVYASCKHASIYENNHVMEVSKFHNMDFRNSVHHAKNNNYKKNKMRSRKMCKIR